MSQFLIKAILYGCRTARTSPPSTGNLGFLQDTNVLLLRWISSSANQQSFTVCYLVSSLGFSSTEALSVSKCINLKTSEKPDKVIKFFKDYGFTMTQISRVVRARPGLLVLNDPEKTILPKLEFLESKGISGPEIAKMLSTFPTVLQRSLAKQIIPSYDYLRNFLQSDKKLIAAIKLCPDILMLNIEKYISPNIDILREHGVPDSIIAELMHRWPNSFVKSPKEFRKIMLKLDEMKFDTWKVKFVVAVHVLWLLSGKSRWERKVDAYKKWGFLEEEILKAFKKYPWFMAVSEDKLIKCMDFFVNQMGLRPCLIAESPAIVTLSLKRRVVPRSLVFQVLLSKGLVDKEVSLNSLLMAPEKCFLRRFVAPYEAEAPELLKLYKCKLEFSKRPVIGDKA